MTNRPRRKIDLLNYFFERRGLAFEIKLENSQTLELYNVSFHGEPIDSFDDIVELRAYILSVIMKRYVDGKIQLGDSNFHFSTVEQTVRNRKGKEVMEFSLKIEKYHGESLMSDDIIDYSAAMVLDAGLQRCIQVFRYRNGFNG